MLDEEFSCNLSDLITRLDAPPIVYAAKPPKLLQDRYLIGGQLGEGSYGKVKLCIDRRTGQRLAVKIVTLRLVRKISHGLENVDREAATMRALRHPNVTRLYADFFVQQRRLASSGYGYGGGGGSGDNNGKRYLVMEWAVCSIHDLQTKGLQPPLDAGQACRHLPESQARHYFRQLLAGVEYLHSQRIVHKDLKPGNLLLTPGHAVKIADFGVCERLPDGSADDTITGSQATPAIQPPEVANGTKQFSGHKLDMYCCGVSLYFMVCGRVPYSGKNVLLIYESIAAGKYTVADWVSQECRRLIADLMAQRFADRPSVEQVRLRYDWMLPANDDEPGPAGRDCWVQLEDHFDVETAEAAVARVTREYEEALRERERQQQPSPLLEEEASELDGDGDGDGDGSRDDDRAKVASTKSATSGDGGAKRKKRHRCCLM